MPLLAWKVERINTIQNEGGWKFSKGLLATCPRCKNSIILPLSWHRKNQYGTAPCPICFKTSRMPPRRDITG